MNNQETGSLNSDLERLDLEIPEQYESTSQFVEAVQEEIETKKQTQEEGAASSSVLESLYKFVHEKAIGKFALILLASSMLGAPGDRDVHIERQPESAITLILKNENISTNLQFKQWDSFQINNQQKEEVVMNTQLFEIAHNDQLASKAIEKDIVIPVFNEETFNTWILDEAGKAETQHKAGITTAEDLLIPKKLIELSVAIVQENLHYS
jgi:hypothetical protein